MWLDRLRIRGKLGIVVALPLIAVAGLTVPVVQGRVRIADRAGATAAKVQTAGRVGEVARDLQAERLLAVAYALKIVDRERLTTQTAATDARITALRHDSSITLPKAVADHIGGMPSLAPLRAGVLAGTARLEELAAGYSTLITDTFSLLQLEAGEDIATAEGRQVIALDAALRTDEGVSLAFTHLLIIAGTKDPAMLIPYFANLSQVGVWGSRVTSYGTPAQGDLYLRNLQEGTVNRLGAAFNNPLSANPLTALAEVSAAQLFPTLQEVVNLGAEVERKIVEDVTAVAEARRASALLAAYLIGGVALLTLLIVVLLSLAAARAVVRPLTQLTAAAERVSRVAEAELVRVADDDAEATGPMRLDAINVTARDEIGDLARAFERVQGTAAGLVERQVAGRRNTAQMFGHIGRRTQNLVTRQAALIDDLERQEADPQRLHHLYRLDHVVRRLRRSAGSLIVIAGASGIDEQVRPLPLPDVLQLALGEIEDYTRVDVAVPYEVVIAPVLVNDLMLMLAELMDNATEFSPPHVRVTVTAVPLPSGVRVDVIDHGIGLAGERMAQENARLERRERLDLVPTEVLGLFVVGRLARRHGISVALSPTDGGGVTASIHIGHQLLLRGVERPRHPVGRAGPAAGNHFALPTAVAATTPTGMIDEAAVYRAARSIAAAEPWSAFVAHRRAITGQQPAVGAAEVPRQSPPPQWPVPAVPDAMVVHAGASPSVLEDPDAPLERRRPGATLQALRGDARITTPSIAPQTHADPDQARDLFDQFEAGVSQALYDARHHQPFDEGPR